MALCHSIITLIRLPAIMAFEYDVFLSFRGDDTRFSFTDHLHKALVQARIRTFRDDGGIRAGDYIPLAIKRAIGESKIMIVVFSRDYASSTWCLDELVMGMELRHFGRSVLPVFYHLDPSYVRQETGTYGEAIAEHEKQIKQKLEGWKAARKDIAVIRRMIPSNIGEKIYDEMMAEIEKYFKEMAEGWKAARKEMEDLRRMVASNIWDKIEIYDEKLMSGIEEHFKKRMEAARKEIANLGRIVAYDIGEVIGKYDEVMVETERYFEERIEGWKAALEEAALLKGVVVQNGYESQFIQYIVEEVEKHLTPTVTRDIVEEVENHPTPTVTRENHPTPTVTRDSVEEVENHPTPTVTRENHLTPTKTRDIVEEVENHPTPTVTRDIVEEVENHPTPNVTRDASNFEWVDSSFFPLIFSLLSTLLAAFIGLTCWRNGIPADGLE